MADPVIADYFRVMAVWQRKTGLPSDVMVNSFVFRNQNLAGPLGGGLEGRIRTALDEFYFGRVGDTVASISSFMVGAAFEGLTYRIYDLADVPPRPVHVEESTAYGTGSFSTGTPLPEECACVVSWLTAVRGPHGRGRSFLGGFGNQAVSIDADSGTARVGPTLQSSIQTAADRLLGDNNQDVELHILGAQGPNRVRTGYIDNAWDTQRRRGLKPTSRVSIAGIGT